MKQVITKKEKMQLVGLLTLARQHQKIVRDCEDIMLSIVEEEDEYGSFLSDAIYDDENIDKILKNMGITVA